VHEIGAGELADGGLSSRWDVVCFDFDYPEKAGLRLIPAAKSRWPSAPILMLTMQNTADLTLWALRSRVFDLLVKPLTDEEIQRCLARIGDVLQARRTQLERRPRATIERLPLEARYSPNLPVAPRLRLAIVHVAKHFSRRISESEVARLCDMSPSRFCREFKGTFGVTFVEYLTTYRVQQAKRLLENPGMAVGDLALSIGFDDPSYFSRVFRKHAGVSPSEYRQAVTAKTEEQPARLQAVLA
jgi:YesN/AraC family two-component response regulator